MITSIENSLSRVAPPGCKIIAHEKKTREEMHLVALQENWILLGPSNASLPL
jgi:hypothetical protein